MTGFLCAFCAEPLLFHVNRKRKFWYCINCRQEMPVLANKPEQKSYLNSAIGQTIHESKWGLPDRQELRDRIIETTEEGSSIVDAMGNLVFANSQMAAILGYSVEEMLWLPLITFIDSGDRHNITEKLVQCRQGVDGKIECKFRRKDGLEVWAIASTNSIFTETNCYAGTLLVIADITKQKQAEAALIKQKEREKALNRITQAIRSSLNLETVFSGTILPIRELMKADYVIIVQYLPERQVWRNVSESRSHQDLPTALGREICDRDGKIAAELYGLESICSNCIGTHDDKLNNIIAKTAFGNWLLVPLYLGTSLWGAIAIVTDSQATDNGQESETEWLRVVANQLSMGINQVFLYQQLETARKKLNCLAVLDRQAAEIKNDGEVPCSVAGDRPISPNQSPSVAVTPTEEEVDNEINYNLLMSYVAYYISRGQSAIGPQNGILPFNGVVYDYNGYHQSFQSFWQQLKQRHDFHKLYIKGDIYCFGDFLNRRCTVRECARCQLPISVEDGNLYKLPWCNGFCELKSPVAARKSQPFDEEATLTRVLAIGTVVTNKKTVKELLARNGFAVTFVGRPEEIIPESLPDTVDIVVIHAEVSSKVGEVWAQQLRRHPQLLGTPIVALSGNASQTLPWTQRSLGMEDYLLTPLGGDRLAIHLRQVSPSSRPFVATDLNWFPR